ncbi:uncharacterized protein BDV14DRAFT_192684 [Aspergillus stella-maris]|uniref:uncharacterized protein n=1 Tax=Aspergillus stella-maris TaxID=1810926 RepID=UPI003CCDE679
MLHESITSLAPSVDYEHFEIPVVGDDDLLADVVHKLHGFFTSPVFEGWYTFEEIRSNPHPRLRILVNSLAEDSHNTRIILALMILRWKFDKDTEDDGGQNEARGYLCEYVAWQFLCHLNQRELIVYLLEELQRPSEPTNSIDCAEAGMSSRVAPTTDENIQRDENTPLLSSSASRSYGLDSSARQGHPAGGGRRNTDNLLSDAHPDDEFGMFFGLNSLEIATIAHAKKFLSQKVVQKVVNDIWNGEIVFWDSLSVHSTKNPQVFNKRTADPYSRLRVPVYRKAFEAAFFVSFLLLYYAVLIERKPTGIGRFEAILYVWIAAFAYDELSGLVDSGMLFYQMTFWNLWDVCIIGTGIAFMIANEQNCDRIFSLVSLNPYFGSLTKAFFRFTPVIIILYLGFLTTFTMLARDRLSSKRMSWILVNVFFGLVFVSVTSLLLISSLVSLMSMSLEGVMSHAREEYLFQLAIYVLESSTSRRLTYFMPPLNLIPLLCIRPMRLFLPAEDIRRVRIVLLRATHLPCVALLWAYESSRRLLSRKNTIAASRSGSTRLSRPASMMQARAGHHPVALASGIDSHSRPTLRARRFTEHGSQRPGQEDLADTLEEMERLRVQVERVSAAVGVHHRNRQ